jgi:hypothetical protein
MKQKYIKFGSGVDWIWGPLGSMNPEQPGPSSSACFDRGGSKIDFGPAMPVQVSSCTSHPAQGCLISRSDLRCTCFPLSPAWFGRSVFASEVGGTLVWGCPCWDVIFIHSTFVIQLLFPVSQRPSLSCYVGGFAAIWQHHILRILGCIFVFYETTNQIFKFICPFGQICKVIRMHYVNNAEKQYFTWHG